MRNELSKNNKWYLPRHRYYELKHFVMQAPDWEKAYNNNLDLKAKSIDILQKEHGDLVGNTAVRNMTYLDRIALIKKAAQLSDPCLSIYILKGVIGGKGYDYLRTKLNIPCSRETYYDRYRKFFWILDKLQDHNSDI